MHLYNIEEIKTEKHRILFGLIVSALFILSQLWITIIFPNLFTLFSSLFMFYYFLVPHYRRYNAYRKRAKMYLV